MIGNEKELELKKEKLMKLSKEELLDNASLSKVSGGECWICDPGNGTCGSCGECGEDLPPMCCTCITASWG